MIDYEDSHRLDLCNFHSVRVDPLSNFPSLNTEEEHRPSVPMDADGRQSRGIPESAVSRRLTRPRNAAAVAAASTASPAAAGPQADQGPEAAAA